MTNVVLVQSEALVFGPTPPTAPLVLTNPRHRSCVLDVSLSATSCDV